MLKASHCICLENTDQTRDLYIKCQMFGVRAITTVFSPCIGIRFNQDDGFAKGACSACLCEVLQNQLNISKGE